MFIHRLKLNNFRKFENLEITFEKPISVIQADNAQGKSSILEAISLITTQSSPFTSDMQNVQNLDQDEYFRIEGEIETDGDQRIYVLFQQGKKKELLIDKNRTTRRKFSENIFSIIFSPEYIDLLMVSPQQRRDYLDSMICSLDMDFSFLLTNMRKVLKQRNSYLKKLTDRFYKTRQLPQNDRQFDYWTKLYSEYSSKVILKRLIQIEKICTDEIKLVYESSLKTSDFVDMIEEEEMIRIHNNSLQDSLKKDVALGYTNVGAHRDDWSIDLGKNVRLHGSRGEKRMAIGKMIFNIQDLYKKVNNFYPVLLLDDISSELDDHNTEEIITNALKEEQQTIITTIRLDDLPEEIVQKAHLIRL